MKNVVHKLKSNDGVSLSVALLFFVVCAAISSIVFASAYASVGRLSNIAKSDQDHYKVTSAASAIQKAVKGQAVTIEEEATLDKDGNVKANSYSLVSFKDASGVTLSDSTDFLFKVGVEGIYRNYLATYASESDRLNKAKFAEMATRTINFTLPSAQDVEVYVTLGSGMDEVDELGVMGSYTIAKDGSVDVKLTSNQKILHVLCVPSVNTTYTYTAVDASNRDSETIVKKVKTLSFDEVTISRS